MYYDNWWNGANGVLTTKLYDGLNIVCECKVCYNVDSDIWTISSWHTSTSYSHKGYGKEVLKHALKFMYDTFMIPDSIEYIWNGVNQYVMDWLERNFEPVCKLPLEAQKYNEIDDWDAHIYRLNRDKVLEYFNIGGKQNDNN